MRHGIIQSGVSLRVESEQQGRKIHITEMALPNTSRKLRFQLKTQTNDLDNVGLLLWNGSLFLADYVWSVLEISDHVILELGAGIGFLSVLCAVKGCKSVLATDIPPVLCLLKQNVLENQVESVVDVLEWNLHHLFPIQTSMQTRSRPFSWNSRSLSAWHQCDLILAADIIYKDDVTFSFICSLPELLSNGRLLYLCVEKRIQFSIQEQRVCAPALDYFLDTLKAFNIQQASNSKPTVQLEEIFLESSSFHFSALESVQDMVLYKLFLHKSNNEKKV